MSMHNKKPWPLDDMKRWSTLFVYPCNNVGFSATTSVITVFTTPVVLLM